MSDIFISYTRKDQPAARKLANALERKDWSVWWDPKLRVGEHFDDVIEQALMESRCVIVLWSERSVHSRYVKDEAAYALNRNKLFPVAIDEVALPFRYEGIQTPRLIDWDGSDAFPAFRKLVGDIKAVLGPSPTEAKAKRQEELKQAEESEKSSGNGTSRKPGQVFLDTLKDGSKGPEMVVIPSGSFEMGSEEHPGECPVHQVTVARFAMGKYPVTFEEYDQFAHAMDRVMPYDEDWGRGNRTVINVSWQDAKDYAVWLSVETGKYYRLPTEAEWEYACRSGGKQEKYCGGNDVNRVAWHSDNSGGKTHPVGKKSANDLGLYDMSGNVWEWVGDWYDEGYYGESPRNNPKGPSNGSARVVRGGGWFGVAEYCRSAFRLYWQPGRRYGYLGFRLARTNP